VVVLFPLVAAAALFLIQLYRASESLSEAWYHLTNLRPVVLEVEGLEERLKAVPKRRLTESEIQAYERDGVLIVRGVVPDRALLEDLRPALRQHQQIHSAVFIRPWIYNGVSRILLRSGLLTDVPMQLHKAPAELQQGPIWGTDGDPVFSASAWHQDLPVGHALCENHLITAWLAITDAPHGLEFLRGTADCEERMRLQQGCNSSKRYGPPGERLLDASCVQRWSKENVDPKLGYSSWHWADLQAGDMALFHGNIAHRGVVWSTKRMAVSVRLTSRPGNPSNNCSEAGSDSFFPGAGVPPLKCMREGMFPRPYNLWPKWKGDLLPPAHAFSSRHVWLRWAVSGLGRALLAV